MFYPENIEEKIDFTVSRDELLRRCASPLGRERVDAMRMETDYETVMRLLGLTDQMLHAQSDPMLSFPRGDIHDIREAISRIRIEGLFLDEAELDAYVQTLFLEPLGERGYDVNGDPYGEFKKMQAELTGETYTPENSYAESAEDFMNSFSLIFGSRA